MYRRNIMEKKTDLSKNDLIIRMITHFFRKKYSIWGKC